MNNENKIEWNKVTWYSKWGAIILFLVVIPVLAFYIGTQYKEAELAMNGNPPTLPVVPDNHLDSTVTNPAQNSNWKTYSDKDKTFQINYPALWSVQETQTPWTSTTDHTSGVDLGVNFSKDGYKLLVHVTDSKNADFNGHPGNNFPGLNDYFVYSNKVLPDTVIFRSKLPATADIGDALFFEVDSFNKKLGLSGPAIINNGKAYLIELILPASAKVTLRSGASGNSPTDYVLTGVNQQIIDEFDAIVSTFKFTK